MVMVWNLSAGRIPIMDMDNNGSLSAVVDWDRGYLYLVKPDGESRSFDLQGSDAVEPVVAGVVVKEGKAYVLANYAGFTGIRVYSWNGKVSEERNGGTGSVADWISASPNGKHVCYLITTGATTQELVCDGRKTTLKGAGSYSMVEVSDGGLVAVGSGGEAGNVLIFRNGSRILTLRPESHMVVLYGDRIVGELGGRLKVLNEKGDVLAESGGYKLKWSPLLTPNLRATGMYLLWTDGKKTLILTWSLRRVHTLPGRLLFANENFAITAEGKTLDCYSLRDFHRVFRLEVPERPGLVELSHDGRVLLVSSNDGRYWLYGVAKSNGAG